MVAPTRGDRHATLAGTALTVLAATSLCVGAASLVDAADGWQDVLNRITEYSRALRTCQQSVPGWGDGAVLVLTVVTILLLATTVYATTDVRRWAMMGQFSALTATVPVAILWLDTYIVGGAPSGDCDGLGLSGAASAAINRAGWLFAATFLLCLLSTAAISARQREMQRTGAPTETAWTHA